MSDPRLLLIESDSSASEPLVTALESAGATVEVCEDGTSGLARAEAWTPSLIIVSAELDGGLTGYAVCQRLKQLAATRSIPVFLTSSKATEAIFAQHARMPTRAQGYFRKPIEAAALVDAVRELVPLGARPSDKLFNINDMELSELLSMSIDTIAVSEDRGKASVPENDPAAETHLSFFQRGAEASGAPPAVSAGLAGGSESGALTTDGAPVIVAPPPPPPPPEPVAPPPPPPPPPPREPVALAPPELPEQFTDSEAVRVVSSTLPPRRLSSSTSVERLDLSGTGVSARGNGERSASFAREILTLREALNEKERELLALNDEIFRRDHAVLEAEERIELAIEQLEQLQNERDFAIAERDQEREGTQELRDALQAAEGAREGLLAAVAALEAERDLAISSLEVEQDKTQAAQNARTEAEGLRASLEKERDEAVAALEEVAIARDAAVAALDEVTAASETAGAALVEMTALRDAAAASLEEATAARDAAVASLDEAATARDEAVAARETLELEHLEALEAHEAALAALKESLGAERDEAAAARDEALAARESLQKELEALEQARASLEQERDEAAAARDALAIARDEAVAALDEVTAARDALAIARDEATASRDEAIAARDMLEADLAAADDARSAAIDELANLQGTLAQGAGTIESAFASAGSKLGLADEAIRALTEDLHALRDYQRKLEAVIATRGDRLAAVHEALGVSQPEEELPTAPAPSSAAALRAFSEASAPSFPSLDFLQGAASAAGDEFEIDGEASGEAMPETRSNESVSDLQDIEAASGRASHITAEAEAVPEETEDLGGSDDLLEISDVMFVEGPDDLPSLDPASIVLESTPDEDDFI